MSDLVLLTLATTAFVGTHLLLSHPLRAPVVSRFGAGGFLGIYIGISWRTIIPLV